MLPRCIWAAIRALHPSGAHGEPIPEAADYVPPDGGTADPDDAIVDGAPPDDDWLFL